MTDARGESFHEDGFGTYLYISASLLHIHPAFEYQIRWVSPETYPTPPSVSSDTIPAYFDPSNS